MTVKKNKLIFLVDDDELFLKSLQIEFKQKTSYDIETFLTGELCIDKLGLNPDMIVLDYYLNDNVKNAVNGLEILDKVKIINPYIPIIMLSSQDSIDVAVDCMKHKALDYVVKSETAFFRLQKSIDAYFQNLQLQKTINWYMEKM